MALAYRFKGNALVARADCHIDSKQWSVIVPLLRSLGFRVDFGFDNHFGSNFGAVTLFLDGDDKVVIQYD